MSAVCEHCGVRIVLSVQTFTHPVQKWAHVYEDDDELTYYNRCALYATPPPGRDEALCQFVVGEQNGEPVKCGAVRAIHGDALGMASHEFHG